jgi:hypothetical protein
MLNFNLVLQKENDDEKAHLSARRLFVAHLGFLLG